PMLTPDTAPHGEELSALTMQHASTSLVDPDLDVRHRIPGQSKTGPVPAPPLLGPHGGPLRVLAVGINYGPEHTGIAPYTTQLCEYLVERGAEVSGLTGGPPHPGWTG